LRNSCPSGFPLVTLPTHCFTLLPSSRNVPPRQKLFFLRSSPHNTFTPSGAGLPLTMYSPFFFLHRFLARVGLFSTSPWPPPWGFFFECGQNFKTGRRSVFPPLGSRTCLCRSFFFPSMSVEVSCRIFPPHRGSPFFFF